MGWVGYAIIAIVVVVVAWAILHAIFPDIIPST
jgi:hypothetical protein